MQGRSSSATNRVSYGVRTLRIMHLRKMFETELIACTSGEARPARAVCIQDRSCSARSSATFYGVWPFNSLGIYDVDVGGL